MKVLTVLYAFLNFLLWVEASRSLGQGPKQRKYGRNVGRPQSKRSGNLVERSSYISPKVVIISLFDSEADVWYENMPSLLAQNITIPGLSPLFPDVHCVEDGSVCQMTTGEGEINAAASASALLFSSQFNLTKTYFLVAGIAGINPHVATTGSVTFARYAVQFDLQYEFSEYQVPSNDTSGWFPQDSYYPDTAEAYDYPGTMYGTEIFELNENLRQRMLYLGSLVSLYDTPEAQAYRENYGYAPANQPPSIVACDTGTSNNYWSGSVLGYAYSNYTKLLTNGSGTYCATQQEDNGICEIILRADVAGKADFSRLVIMRTASDFDRAPSTEDEIYHLLYAEQEGFEPSIQNIWRVGSKIVEDIEQYWIDTYDVGLAPGNYIGDAFNSLAETSPDIGAEAYYIN